MSTTSMPYSARADADRPAPVNSRCRSRSRSRSTLFGFGADEVVQLHAADGGAQLAVDPLAQDGPGPVRRADRAQEGIHGSCIGDAPADVGVKCEGLVDGVAPRIARQQFRSGKVEVLQAAVKPLA